MVDLHVYREAVVVQPLDQVEFPQRTVPVEQAAVQPGHQREEFTDPTGPGQCREPHMVFEVDIILVSPAQRAEHRTGPGRLASVHRRQFGAFEQPSVQRLHVLGRGAVRQPENVKPTDMHWVFTGFGCQEHGIEGRDERHDGAPLSSVIRSGEAHAAVDGQLAAGHVAARV